MPDINHIDKSNNPTHITLIIMKTKIFLTSLFLITITALSMTLNLQAQTPIDETHFPDSVFRAYVQENFDTDQDRTLSQQECEAVLVINVSGNWNEISPVADLKGIELFPNLDSLSGWNSSINSLNIENNKRLRVLEIYNTPLQELNTTHNTELKYLDITSTKIKELDLSGNPQLNDLKIALTTISKLDLSQNGNLKSIDISNTSISGEDLESASQLEWINISETKIEQLRTETFKKLKGLYCAFSEIKNLDLSQNLELQSLSIQGTAISELDVTHNPELIWLVCWDAKKIEQLDVRNCKKLQTLYILNTKIKDLDISQNPELIDLICSNTEISSLDVSQNPDLTSLDASGSLIRYLDVSHNPELTTLKVENCQLSHIDLSQNPKLETISISDNTHPVKCEVGGTYDLSQIPGFDLSRVEWLGDSPVNGTILTFEQERYFYNYRVPLAEGEQTVLFKIIADPSLANGPATPAKAHFQALVDGNILHLENTRGLSEIFDINGKRIYVGEDHSISLPNPGVYIVRNQGRSIKVVRP